MSTEILQVDRLSKLYKLGEINTGSLSSDLQRWIYKLKGKEDPFEKLAEINDRQSKSQSGYVWSLKDVSFSVNEGEVFGIIGKNGAGKSTLLKLLSKITKPTKGTIKIGGRIASLLEVGTGFHPDLSGRENVFLNGAILGMRKNEIKKRFDEIVEFSGIERYIDTPVKRYSSGMFVRLAFAVAAHLEQEILIIDEVLAVGDADFQKKCLGKMQDVSKNQGRTVLFVSHNVAAVRQLCNRAMLLEKGTVKIIGGIEPVLDVYHDSEKDIENGVRNAIPDTLPGYFLSWKLKGSSNFQPHSCESGDNVTFDLKFKTLQIFTKCIVYLRLIVDEGTILFLAKSDDLSNAKFTLEQGIHNFQFKIPLSVRPDKYEVQLGFSSEGKFVDIWYSTTKLKVSDSEKETFHELQPGLLYLKSDFKLESGFDLTLK